jgi:hypothetical protein
LQGILVIGDDTPQPLDLGQPTRQSGFGLTLIQRGGHAVPDPFADKIERNVIALPGLQREVVALAVDAPSEIGIGHRGDQVSCVPLRASSVAR